MDWYNLPKITFCCRKEDYLSPIPRQAQDRKAGNYCSCRTLFQLYTAVLFSPGFILKKKGKVIDSKSSRLYSFSLLLFSLARDIYVRLLVQRLLTMMVEAPQAVQSYLVDGKCSNMGKSLLDLL
jgi:hypothetical protein